MAKRTVQGLLVVVVILGVFGVTRMRAQQDGTRFRIPSTAVTASDGSSLENHPRPVDVEVWHDGSLLVSDDEAGAIYRIFYRNPADAERPTGAWVAVAMARSSPR